MRLTTGILASLFLVASAAVSNANIIFTPTLISSSLTATTQSFSINLALTGANDIVNQFAFSATVSTASGPAIALTGPITSVNLVPTNFGLEFTHSINEAGTPNGIGFSGTNLPNPGGGTIFGATEGSPYTRSRVINFTVNRGISNQTLNVAFAAATVPGGNGVNFTGVVRGDGTSVPANFNTTTFAGGTISAVPEPTSIALVAMVGGIVFAARRRTFKANKKQSELEV